MRRTPEKSCRVHSRVGSAVHLLSDIIIYYNSITVYTFVSLFANSLGLTKYLDVS